MWWKALANEIAWKGRLINPPLWICDACGSSTDLEVIIMHTKEHKGDVIKDYRSVILIRCERCGSLEMATIRGRIVNAKQPLFRGIPATDRFMGAVEAILTDIVNVCGEDD